MKRCQGSGIWERITAAPTTERPGRGANSRESPRLNALISGTRLPFRGRILRLIAWASALSGFTGIRKDAYPRTRLKLSQTTAAATAAFSDSADPTLGMVTE